MGKIRDASVMIVASTVISVCTLAQAAKQPVVIDSGRQLFADASLIGSLANVELNLNPPRKTYERILVAEYEWEEMGVGAYSTVLKDGDQYKMWYGCRAEGNREAGEPGLLTNWCYATSSDGIHWEKPLLDLVNFRGSTKNNIVLENFHGTVFLDPKRTGGDRFKLIGKQKPERGLLIFSSPDGLRWKPLRTNPVLSKGHFDTQNLAFWDDRLQKYVAYVRRWDPQPQDNTDPLTPLCCRRVGRSETDNLEVWPQPEIVFGFDEKDPPNADVYTPSVIPYRRAPGLYLMFPSVYFHYDPAKHSNRRNLGPLDIQFAASRDGRHWSRPVRTPYVGLGKGGDFDSGALYMSVGMLFEGDEIWMYYTSNDFLHGGPVENLRKSGVVSRLVQRVDGFISADAAYEGGELTTVPIIFTGQTLRLNLDTGALGTARVELLDAAGRVMPGFTADDCDSINGNSTEHTVTWNGKDDVSAWSGKPLQVRFVMRSTKLFSFRFAP